MEDVEVQRIRYAFRTLAVLDSVLNSANQDGFFHTRTDAFVRATSGHIYDLSYLFSNESLPPQGKNYAIPFFYEPNSVEEKLASCYDSGFYQRMLAVKDNQIQLFDLRVHFNGAFNKISQSIPHILPMDLLQETESGKKLLRSFSLEV